MPFYFTCPYCFKKTLVDEKYAGQTGPCASCAKTVTLPTLISPGSLLNNRSSSQVYVTGQVSSDARAHTDDRVDSGTDLSFGNPAVSSSPFTATSVQPPPILTSALVLPAIRSTSRPRNRRYWILGAGTIAVLLLGFVAYSLISAIFSSSVIRDIQLRRNRALCMNNLSKIAQALNNYAATHGTYPPPIVYDDKGKPKHSWRVLILQELGEHTLYGQYKMDEPWDSEHNSTLFSRCPSVYASPGSGNVGESSYFLIVGGNTVFADGSSLKPQDIRDGLDRTILVAESKNVIHEWTKPIDIAVAGNGQIKFGGTHNGGFTAAAADGTPFWIPDDTAPELIDSLITPNGSEPLDPSPFAVGK